MRDFAPSADQPPMVSIQVFELQGEDKKKLRFMMLPIGMLIKPGFRVVIDKAEPLDGKYDMCFQNACTAEIEIGSSALANMKKGQNLAIVLRVPGGDPSGRELTFNVPLKDFGPTFDGKPTDPKVLEEQRQALQQQLQKKAEEQRKQLEQQQQSGAAAPAAPRPGRARRSSGHASRAEAISGLAASVSRVQAGDRGAWQWPALPGACRLLSTISSSRCRRASARHRAQAEPIATVGGALERLADLGMAHRLAGVVRQEVLLRHVGDVLAVFVFGIEVVERLILGRADFRRNRAPPLLRVVEHRVDVEDHATERIDPVFDHLSDIEFCDCAGSCGTA